MDDSRGFVSPLLIESNDVPDVLQDIVSCFNFDVQDSAIHRAISVPTHRNIEVGREEER